MDGVKRKEWVAGKVKAVILVREKEEGVRNERWKIKSMSKKGCKWIAAVGSSRKWTAKNIET